MLLVAVVVGLLVYGLAHSSVFNQSYTAGYARSYIAQGGTRLDRIDGLVTDLTACLSAARPGGCAQQAKDVSSAAAAERRGIAAQTRIGLFPECLKPSAGQEEAALDQVAAASARLTLDNPPAAQANLLQAVQNGMEAARGALSSAEVCLPAGG